MIDFNKLFPKDLYHSYVIEGEHNVALALEEYFKKSENTKDNNIDFFCRNYDAFTIDDSSDIKEWQVIKNNNDAKKICILGFHFINHDAERTLLKMLEEPKDNTYFFLITPDSSLLLDTILSRVQVIKINLTIDDDNKYKQAVEFLKSPISLRLEKIAELVKNYKDVDGSGGLRHEATILVNSIEYVLHKQWQKDKKSDLKDIFEILKKARNYLSIPGSSPKMILEQIALVI